MKYIIYDIESTGFLKRDEVIEFGCIVADERFVPKGYYRFYCYTQVPIAPGAAKVNGLSASKLMELSDGDTFEDMFFKLPFVKDKDLVWVSYSRGGFDERLINQTLRNNGLPAYGFGERKRFFQKDPGYVLDAYAALQTRVFDGKSKKLAQALLELGISERQFDEYFYKVTGHKATFHEALYDSLVLWYVVNHYRKRLSFELL